MGFRVAFLAAVCGLWARFLPANEYFLFGEGEVWVYGGDRIWREFEVVDRDGEIVMLREELLWTPEQIDKVETLDGPYIRTLRVRETEVDILLPDVGFQPYLRFEEGRYVRHDIPTEDCNTTEDNMSVRLWPRPIEIPFGTFVDCLRIFLADNCADSGRIEELWCPSVGLVAVADGDFNSFLIRIERPEPVPFRRGDANVDGTLDVSDGIAILSYLFLGTSDLACEEAADVDDAGTIDVSDVVALFGYLFLGARAPSTPGPSCGEDPTEDLLSCGEYPCR